MIDLFNRSALASERQNHEYERKRADDWSERAEKALGRALAAETRADKAEVELRRLKPQRGDTLHCSFCDKSQHDVKKLIAGPTVFICDECVLLCVGVCLGRSQRYDPSRHHRTARSHVASEG